MNNNPIGIMDSGVGGLSVWQAIVRELPGESLTYIADSAHVPYGPREPEEIYMLAKRLVEFLISENVKIIVVACNTITVSCLDKLRQEYPLIPMIGTVPVIKTAAAVTKKKRIGIFSTTRTASSAYQQALIQKFAHDCDVVNIGTDDLVPFVEKGIIEGEDIQEFLKEVLKPFIEKNVDTVALGCTHYPFVEKTIQGILGSEVTLLEPSGAIARHTKRILEQNHALSDGLDPEYLFVTTGDESAFRHSITTLLGEKLKGISYGVDTM
jgi:glutamate racemase